MLLHPDLISINNNAFFVKGWHEVVNPGDPVYFLFKTPTNVHVHWAYGLLSDSDVIFQVYHTPTLSDLGTPFTAPNMNLANDNTHQTLCYADPTVTSDGTLVFQTRVGSSKAVGSISAGYLITGAIDTYYLTKAEKVAAGTGYLDFDFYWVEDFPER